MPRGQDDLQGGLWEQQSRMLPPPVTRTYGTERAVREGRSAVMANAKREAGFSLLEVLIAAVILSLLALGAMATMRSTTGFTVMAGRTSEGVGRSFESWEPLRNEVA